MQRALSKCVEMIEHLFISKNKIWKNIVNISERIQDWNLWKQVIKGMKINHEKMTLSFILLLFRA